MSVAADKVRSRATRSHANGVSSRKRKYERTTPVGRAKKNLAKAIRVLDLVKVRLVSWGAHSPDTEDFAPESVLDVAMDFVVRASEAASAAADKLTTLEKSGFVPAKRSSAVVFEVDDEVSVSDKHRGKYLEVYPTEVVDRLVVSKVLPSGEIAVKHGKVAFIVPKSHLLRRGAA